MKQAVSYSRFSSSGQAKGSSIERQRAMFEEWLASSSERYYESSLSAQDKGLSAYKKDNLKRGLGDIISAIESGLLVQGDALVIEAIDRLSRAAALDAFEVISKILKAGISLITLEDNLTYTEESIRSSQLYVLVGKIQAANDYSERLSARVSAAWERRREKARAGIAPDRIHSYPMWIDKSTKKLNIHAPMVKDIISLYLSGFGLREINSNIRNTYQFEVSPRTLGKWLDNYDAMLGLWHGVQAFEAIVSQEEFFEIQEARKQRTKTPKQPTFHLTSGLLSCAECGGSFNFRIQQPASTKSAPKGSEAYNNRPKIVYGNCRTYLQKKSCSNGVTIPEEVALLVLKATQDETLIDIAARSALGALNRHEYAGLVEKKANAETKFNGLYRLAAAIPESMKEPELLKMKQLANEISSLNEKILKQNEKLLGFNDALKNQREKWIESSGAANYIYSRWGDPDEELQSETEKELNKLQSNDFLRRLALKQDGYRIIVNKTKTTVGEARSKKIIAELWVNSRYYIGHNWKIMSRSQKLGCYIIEHTWPEQETDFSNENNNPVWTIQSERLEARRDDKSRLLAQ